MAARVRGRADQRGAGVQRFMVSGVVLVTLAVAGCAIPRHIVELVPPPQQPPLQELERHLDYQDPDAGRPDYVRAR